MIDIGTNIFFQGYDTTANTLIYACIMLALYPHIQDKVLEEVREFHNNIGSSDASSRTSSEYLAMFPYLTGFMVRRLLSYVFYTGEKTG
jgi:cytochrome P450